MTHQTVVTGIIVEETTIFSLGELSRACGKPAEWIIALVEEGVIEPVGSDRSQWKFKGHCLRRVRIVQRLVSDLGLNLAGAALALELLEEVETLRNRIAALEK
ncbi:MAG: chaperone modulator CbpM [Desulfobacterales bacterium]|nr:chaperone modulator CbpM [Desulfobacterales bacterium]